MATQNRRTFIKKTSLTIPLFSGLILASSQGAKAVSPNEKIRIGLIGSGGMGCGDLATFLRYDDVDCPIICDIDDARITNGVAECGRYRDAAPDTVKDFRQVLDRKDVDAVLVCTPDHWHALPTVLGCQAGKDVYVEKPLSVSVAESRAMLTAVQENKRIAQMGTQWRSAEHFAEAAGIVQSGELGKIRQVRAWAYLDWIGGIGNPPDQDPPAGVDYDMWLGPAPKRPFNPNRFHFNFRWYWDYAGGLMTDWGVHLINVGLWAMGTEDPQRVYSTGGKFVVEDNTETPDTQCTVYDFPSYTFIWEHQMQGGVGIGGRPHGLCFSGSKATLILDSDGWEIIPEKNSGMEPRQGKAVSDGRPQHVRNFLDCVKSRQQPVENLELGHFVTTVAHLGNVALRANRQIAWDPRNERIVNDAEANALLSVQYREPWSLPYMK
ncbi:MAG: Gfo/Idh/MocA family oxidoreductase [bacterium]|jgi:predicted dehydrogenase|nr:Gfo/Idh/MocA family oxidoreductase [bacterium]